MFGKLYKKPHLLKAILISTEVCDWIKFFWVFIPSIWANIFFFFGSGPLQSQGWGVQTWHCNRLQPKHLHTNFVDKVWPERGVGFTVNWRDQQKVLHMTLLCGTNPQLSWLVILLSFVRNAGSVICLSIPLTYFKWININFFWNAHSKITTKWGNVTYSDISIFESIQLFNKMLRDNILSSHSVLN